MKKVLPILLLAAASTCAHADTWQFKYKGFLDVESGSFDPTLVLQGSFEGSDADGDGIIELAELTQLRAGGRQFMGCDEENHVHCSIESFSYSLTGNLSFQSRYMWHDEFSMSSTLYVRTGQDVWYGRTSNDGSSSSERWLWTDQTLFAITPAPVPEPATYAMLGFGALLLGARQLQANRSRRG
jgi:hypothetical protein